MKIKISLLIILFVFIISNIVYAICPPEGYNGYDNFIPGISAEKNLIKTPPLKVNPKDFLKTIGASETQLEKFKSIALRDLKDRKGATISELSQIGFNKENINKMPLSDIAISFSDQDFQRILSDITDTTIAVGRLNLRKAEDLYSAGRIKDIKGSKQFYRYASDETNGLIKIYKELITKIEGSRSVVTKDAFKYAEHTKQIKKLQDELKNIENLHNKYQNLAR